MSGRNIHNAISAINAVEHCAKEQEDWFESEFRVEQGNNAANYTDISISYCWLKSLFDTRDELKQAASDLAALETQLEEARVLIKDFPQSILDDKENYPDSMDAPMMEYSFPTMGDIRRLAAALKIGG
jgi:hypothetical protein